MTAKQEDQQSSHDRPLSISTYSSHLSRTAYGICFRKLTNCYFIFFIIAICGIILLSHMGGLGRAVSKAESITLRVEVQKREKYRNKKANGPLYHFDSNKFFKSEFFRSIPPTSEAGIFFNKSADVLLSEFHREVLRKLFLAFDDLWRVKLGHLYFLWGGTLLGAYRHGGIIPYDDDIDLLVDEKYMKKFYDYLNGSSLTAANFNSVRKVFFRNLSLSVKIPIGRFPNIEVHFYSFIKGGKHMTAIKAPLNQPTTNYFPENFMPFEGRLLPSPRCVIPALTEYYKTDFESKCCNHHYSHRMMATRSKNRTFCIKCSHLYGLIPFTTWKRLNATHGQQFVLPPRLKKRDRLSWKLGLTLPMPDC